MVPNLFPSAMGLFAPRWMIANHISYKTVARKSFSLVLSREAASAPGHYTSRNDQFQISIERREAAVGRNMVGDHEIYRTRQLPEGE